MFSQIINFIKNNFENIKMAFGVIFIITFFSGVFLAGEWLEDKLIRYNEKVAERNKLCEQNFFVKLVKRIDC